MIISASFKNLYSFKDKTTIDFVSGKKDWKLKDFTSVMGIFGANASGKTNVLSALHAIVCQALFSNQGKYFHSGLDNISGFMMNKEPKEFELVFTDEKAENTYKYFLKFDLEKIIEEKFEEKKGNMVGVSFVTLFHRDPKVEIPYINYELLDLSLDYYKNVQHLTADTILSSVTQVSKYAMRITNSLFFPAMSRLDKFVNFNYPDSLLLRWVGKNPKLKDRIVNTIKKFDIGFEDIEIKKLSEDKYEILEVKKSGNKTVHLDYEKSASKGTRELVKLLYSIYEYGLQFGSFVLFDEIDTLHPLILEEIINIFRSPETNPKKAQLIFTAHNPYLLDILDKNEIWFAEKNDQNSTELYSLSDFAASKDTRSGISFAKKYLAGKYGAVPKI